MDVEMSDCDQVADHEQGLHTFSKTPLTSSAISGYLHPNHHNHDSISTASSNNSSPTTTISTVDSVTSEERSPSSSPDSPVAIIPLSAFKSSSVPTGDNLGKLPSPQHTYRSMSPIKKARNTKNLSLNFNQNRPSTSASLVQNGNVMSVGNRAASAPTSPGFIPPPSMPRRRPSNLSLTIRLPGPEGGKLSGGPGKLRHHVSSPSLFNPPAKSTISGRPPRLFTPPSASGHESLSSSIASSQLSSSPQDPPGPLIEMDEEDIAMMANDGEGPKSPSYPNGPQCIYEPYVYLYLEPSVDVAKNFDVVINVAREVVNPFDAAEKKKLKEKNGQPGLHRAFSSPNVPTSSSSLTLPIAEEQESTSGINTPTISSFAEKEGEQQKRPEYIHMPWDHNTSILEDLPRLMEIISKRSNERKKVLVHCQCGVSRSASLIIAYGLFMNPRQTVQEAYDFVKARSKWITPNMSLIYQLSDWRAKLMAQQTMHATWRGRKGANNSRGRPRMIPGHPTRAASTSDPAPFCPGDFEEPMTAPLPHLRQGQMSPPVPERRSSPAKQLFVPAPVRTRSDDGSMILGIEHGPMSAPPGMINIPGTSSVESHGAGWGAGDAGTGYVPPPLPPSAAYPLEQESDIVGDLVGFPARRGSGGDGLPPPTPGFGPKGGLSFGSGFGSNSGFGSMRSNRMNKFSAIEDSNDEPPPTPSVGGFGKSMPFAMPPKKKTLPPPPPPKKFSTLPFRREPVATKPADPKPRASFPNELHRRFPSILQSVEEPPPTPSGLPKSQFFGIAPPVRMPTISSRVPLPSQPQQQEPPTPAEPSPMDLSSPLSETGPRTGVISSFADPRSPVTGRKAMPTVRSIFDVI